MYLIFSVRLVMKPLPVSYSSLPPSELIILIKATAGYLSMFIHDLFYVKKEEGEGAWGWSGDEAVVSAWLRPGLLPLYYLILSFSGGTGFRVLP